MHINKIIDKIKKELVHHFPFIFRKEAEKILFNFNKEFQERWKITSDLLQVKIETPPQLEISFEPINEAFYFEKKKTIRMTSYYMRKNENERFRTIDHEIAHYIQHRINPHLREKSSTSIFSNWYGLFTGKLDKALTEKAFTEGFVTYVASITIGKLSAGLQEVIDILESGNRWKIVFRDLFRFLPYALGYLAYHALSRIESTTFALEMELHESPSFWLEKGREAHLKLEKKGMV